MDKLADNMVSPAAWFLVGPTAVGKTAVAQYLAERTGAAILSADAMLVYRGMDIGTAKPSVAERGSVHYFGLDLADPDEPFSVGDWLQRLRASWMGLRDPPVVLAENSVGGGLIVAGGTGLYVSALTRGLDAAAADPARRAYWQARLAREGVAGLWRELLARAPQAAASLADPENPRRVIRALEHLDSHGVLPDGWRTAPQPRLVGLRLPRAALHARIAARVKQMFASGLIEEVQSLRARFPAWGYVSHTSRSVITAAPAESGKRCQDAEDVSSHTSRSVRTAGEVSVRDGRHGLQRTKDAPGGEKMAQALPLEGLACTAQQAIGYAEVCALLDKRLTREQAIEQIVIRTRQLAKRQETWFRHQAEMTWIEISPDEPVATMAARVLAAWREHDPTPIRLS